MEEFLCAPQTPAEQMRDKLLGSLVGLARATVNEPKTEDTDRVLRAGLALAAKCGTDADALRRMDAIVQTEKHRVAPNCASCTMRCSNTDDFDLARLWNAPTEVRVLKLSILQCLFALAQDASNEKSQEMIDQGLFVLAEDWDEELLSSIVQKAQALCAGKQNGQ